MTTRAPIVRVRTPDGAVREMTDGGSIDLDREVVRDRSGRRIDESAAAAMVEEIEARPGRGRPSLSGEPGTGESKVIRARVPDSLHTAFVARAAREHKAESELLRDVLAEYLGVPADTRAATITTGAKRTKKAKKPSPRTRLSP